MRQVADEAIYGGVLHPTPPAVESFEPAPEQPVLIGLDELVTPELVGIENVLHGCKSNVYVSLYKTVTLARRRTDTPLVRMVKKMLLQNERTQSPRHIFDRIACPPVHH